MRSKITLGIIILIMMISSCTSRSSNANQENHSECIDRVLMLDDSLGTIRNHECERISLSRTIENYVNGLRAINFDGCPKEFKQAFDAHIQAWINVTETTDNYPDLRGEMHQLFDKLGQSPDSGAFNKQVAEIWSTWGNIEKIKNGK
jgi:hypothetical protein